MQAQKASGLIRTLVARTVLRRNYHQGKTHVATYNDLPNPHGCWQTHHDAQQRKYNAHLLFGVVFFGATMLVAKLSGSLYLNYNEPECPANDITYD